MERKLATIRQISSVDVHPNADLLDIVSVDGWKVITKKGEFAVGDFCVYFEIDSFLPVKPEFEFLRKSCFKSTPHLGDGFRLKTIRLRGQLSQGLVIPLRDLPAASDESIKPGLYDPSTGNFDVTEVLGVQKWEPPLAPCLSGQAKGFFPSFIPKTDQERAQNLVHEIYNAFNEGGLFEVTMKLDGSSCTVYFKDGEVGVCSRNLELKMNDDNKDNTFIKTARETKLLDALTQLGLNIAVQGELMGPGVQGNRENLPGHTLFVFDIFNIDTGRKLNPKEREGVYNKLVTLGYNGHHVPVIGHLPLPTASVAELLNLAEEPSLNHAISEGRVYKSHSGDFSFKTINNAFLLSEK